MPQAYDLQKIRTLLNEGFIAEELIDFCRIVPEFQPLYEQQLNALLESELIDLLVTHARDVSQLEKLLTWAKKRNPYQYAAHKPYTIAEVPEEIVSSVRLVAQQTQTDSKLSRQTKTTDSSLSDMDASKVSIEAVGGSIENATIAGQDVQRTSVGQVIQNVFRGSKRRSPSQRNRQAMLKRVNSFWVEGVLEKSLHGLAMIELEMTEKGNAVDDPLNLILKTAEQSEVMLPKGTKPVDIFKQMDRALLILGEPGSGKTMSLLALARDAISEAETDPTKPIPIIFNLSSWTTSKKPIHEWLVDEFRIKYQIPARISEVWIENRELLLLLDGLDEVAQNERNACAVAINTFSQDYGTKNIVVCSRIVDYGAMTSQLKLRGAVLLQPLTSDQVNDYLAEAGDQLEAVKNLIEEDAVLRELTRSPLTLSIMALAYRGMSTGELRGHGLLAERRVHLFETYIDRMFSRTVRTKRNNYSRKQTTIWLSWLAQKMTQHNQTIFLIERMQPSWLTSYFWKIGYVLVSRLIGGICVGLAMGALMSGSRDGLIFGFVGGVTVGCIDLMRLKVNEKNVGGKTGKIPFWKSAVSVGIVWLIVAFMQYITARLLIDIRVLNMSLAWSLAFGGLFGPRGAWQNFDNDIRILEDLDWSIRRLILAGLIGILAFGIIFGSATLLIFYFGNDEVMREWILRSVGWLKFISSDNIRILLGTGLLFGTVIGGPIGLIFGGGPIGKILDLGDVKTEKYEKAIPNQGIRQSLKTSLWSGAGFGFISWSFFALTFIFFSGHIEAIFLSFYDAITVGILAALWFGGLDVIQHYVLQLILYIKGHTTFNYVKFLDYGDELIFLQRVGGSYEFKHNILRDHFAAIAEPTTNIIWKRVGKVVTLISLVVISGIVVVLGWQSINFTSGKSLGPNALIYERQIIHNRQNEHYIACVDQEDKVEVEQGDTVLIEASGNIKVGYFIGNTGPEGRHVAFLGFFPMNIFNRQADIPHGALMCRISDGTNERKWRNCALYDRYFDIFFQNPGTQFEAPIDGCLEFEVNDTEQENNYGTFDIKIQIKK